MIPDRSDERALHDLLAATLRSSFEQRLDDDAFTDAARRVFTFQYERNVPYGAFCDRRGIRPDRIAHWSDIPAVPVAAFKEVPLIAGSPDEAQAVFRTSGTTRGSERRGTHYIRDVSLYHAALLTAFEACLLPDGARMRMVSLVPPSKEAPDSSLAHMIDMVMERLGSESAHCASIQDGLNEHALIEQMRSAARDDAPVCLLGTSFAFVHWLDGLHARGERFALPAGSRLMDTGGYKGRSREVPEMVLRSMYGDLLGLPDSHCVNEYGMTEMCSQFYDSSLRDITRCERRERRKIGPPWVRTRVVDPETLEPVEPGREGLLQHFDLANAGSVMAIQTEDVGVEMEDGFRMLGRVPGATPRGCSIAMDLLIQAARERTG